MEDLLNLEHFSPRIYYFLRGLKRSWNLQKYKRYSWRELMSKDAMLFQERIGRPLDWNHLRSYNEKLQWEKLFHRDPIKATLADKYLVRAWVGEKIGQEYLIPLIGVWDNANDIDFGSLPDSFALKTNCASGDVVIVRDRKALSQRDINRIRYKLNFYLQYDWGYRTFERHYSEIQPRIVAEQLLTSADTDIPDYKFTCFDGVPYCCRVDVGRYHDHRRNTYDLEWNLLPWNAGAYPNTEYELPRPKNYEGMIELAKKLSEGFSQVRVDLYNIDGRIYFGEMTFTSGSGFEPFFPPEMDDVLGKIWKQDCIVPPEYLER